MARRRRNGREVNQKGKSKKRAAGWHKGYAQGVVNEKKIQRALPAFERAAAQEAEIAAMAKENREQVSEWERLLASTARVSPALLDSRAWAW